MVCLKNIKKVLNFFYYNNYTFKLGHFRSLKPEFFKRGLIYVLYRPGVAKLLCSRAKLTRKIVLLAAKKTLENFELVCLNFKAKYSLNYYVFFLHSNAQNQ